MSWRDQLIVECVRKGVQCGEVYHEVPLYLLELGYFALLGWVVGVALKLVYFSLFAFLCSIRGLVSF